MILYTSIREGCEALSGSRDVQWLLKASESLGLSLMLPSIAFKERKALASAGFWPITESVDSTRSTALLAAVECVLAVASQSPEKSVWCSESGEAVV